MHPNVDRIEELRKRYEDGDITQEEYVEFQDLKAEGLLHRDIKPANLMLTTSGLSLLISTLLHVYERLEPPCRNTRLYAA